MLAATRRSKIIELVGSERSVTTDELAAMLEVSPETVRRDLRHLDNQQLVRRVRGGAVRWRSPAAVEPPYDVRTETAPAEKAAIAEAALGLVGSARTIFVDIGTTNAQLASKLLDGVSATVVTPSLRIAEMLSSSRTLTVLIPGGKVRPGDTSTYGETAKEFLRQINPDVAFIGTGAVDAVVGITDFEFEETAVKQVMIANSERVYAMADSNKLIKRAPFRICGLDEVTGIITDWHVDPASLDELTASGARLIVAKPKK